MKYLVKQWNFSSIRLDDGSHTINPVRNFERELVNNIARLSKTLYPKWTHDSAIEINGLPMLVCHRQYKVVVVFGFDADNQMTIALYRSEEVVNLLLSKVKEAIDKTVRNYKLLEDQND